MNEPAIHVSVLLAPAGERMAFQGLEGFRAKASNDWN